MRKFLYGPPNWIVRNFSQEDRRMAAFWVCVVAVLLYPIFGAAVLFASFLGLIGVAGIFTSETPSEDD